MTGLSPGVRLPKDMNAREFARWCSEQSIESVATTAASDAVAAHVALADPHTQYAKDTDLTAAIAALSLASGNYTPTLFNVANISGSTSLGAQYSRVGSTVTVSGQINITPTVGATPTKIGISLPVASNLANSYECNGTGNSIGADQGAIYGDAANDRAEFQFLSSGIVLVNFYFCFAYRVI